jgi:hypothetical protein
VLTTFTSYGQVSAERQVEIIKSLGLAETDSLADPAAMLRRVAEEFERRRALEQGSGTAQRSFLRLSAAAELFSRGGTSRFSGVG